jgi:phage FluMu gp28-like protein
MGFKTFHINSEEVANLRPSPQKEIMLDYLRREKARMTELQYAQQYLAQFLEELSQLFPDKLIESCQTEERTNKAYPECEYYLGVDVARMGKDATTFEIFERQWDILVQRDNQSHTKQLTTETTDQILALDCAYDFRKILIDDGGLGVAVFDALLATPQTSGKVVAINNASRPLNRDETRKKKILKEDLYMNTKNLMERGVIKLLKDQEIFNSLKSVVIESNEVTKDIRIYGQDTHIAEGIIRAIWGFKNRPLDVDLY